MSRMFSFGALVAFVLLLGVLFYRVMATFLVPLFLAGVLVVMFHPVNRWLTQKCNGRAYLGAGLTTAMVLLLVIAPLAFVFSIALVEGLSAVSRFDAVAVHKQLDSLRKQFELNSPYDQELREINAAVEALEEAHKVGRVPLDFGDVAKQAMGWLNQISDRAIASHDESLPTDWLNVLRQSLNELQLSHPSSLHYANSLRKVRVAYHDFRQELLGGPVSALLKTWANPSDQDLRNLRVRILEELKPWLFSATGKGSALLASILIGTLVMCLALFYFFVDGPALLEGLIRLAPIDEVHVRELLAEFDKVSRAVVLSTLLSAIAQSLLASVGYYFAGVQSVMLLSFLTLVASLIPFVGAAAIWLPVTVWIFAVEGRMPAAAGLLLWGFFVVSMIDNVIKPLVLHGQAKLHPLFALLSVLGGIQLLGPIGILVGPMIVAFLQTLLRILHRELIAIERSSAPLQPTPLRDAAPPGAGVAPEAPSEPATSG